MDKITLKWKFGLLPFYAVIILIVGSFLSSYGSTDVEKLFLTPMFDDVNGWEIYTVEHNVKKDKTSQELYDSKGETFYLSRTLDPQLEEDGYTILELDGGTWQHSVYLDGELLYTIDPSIDHRIGEVEFSKGYEGIQGMGEYVRLSLPPNYGGKTLTIAVALNPETEYHGMPMIRMSSEHIQTQLMVSDANRLAMPAAAYMTVAVILIGLFFFDWYHGQKSYSLLLLVLAALIQALRILLNFEFYFSSQFSLNFIPADLLIPLSLGLPMLYLLFQMKRWKKWYMPFLLIPLGLSILFHLLARIPTFTFLSNYPYDAILYISLIALGIFAILEWKDKNTTYRLFAPLLYTTILILLIISLCLVLMGKGDHEFVCMLRTPILMLHSAFQRYGSILLLLDGAISFTLTIKKVSETKSSLSILSMKNDLINENIQSILESSTKIATMRHDMLRHLHTILDLSQEGDKLRLENYLKELTKETETILPVKICSHPIVNALVTRALAKAKKNNIHMEVQVEVPEEITVTDNDLCILLMNMLDNAIEAVSALPTEHRHTIELTIHLRGSYLFVETINPCNCVLTDAKTGLLLSTKGVGHGYGMKAMSEIAQKYHSKLQIKQEHNTMMVRTALLMPEEKNNKKTL